MAHWTDDRHLNIEQKRLDARQAEAREKMTSTNKRDGGEVELLPLPAELADHLDEYHYRYAVEEAIRANVERALAESRAECERLRQDCDEARGLVIEANNSLFGSQGYFHSMNGGAYDKHHLSRAIESLKADSHRKHIAEARAERLAGALRSLLGSVDDLTSYMAEDDEIGYRPCCNVLSYNEHTDDCAITQARAALEQEPQE